MYNINLVTPETDLSDVRLYGWDLEVNGEPYDVFNIPECVHTTGYRGPISLWACPAGEAPSFLNLIQFNGDAPTWGVTFGRVNQPSVKHGYEEVVCYGECWITRNGKQFYQIPASKMEYGLSAAQYLLTKLLESHPISFQMRGWEKEVLGRKVYWRGAPAIIEKILYGNELLIVPDGMEKFKRPEYYDEIKADLLDGNIWWWRE